MVLHTKQSRNDAHIPKRQAHFGIVVTIEITIEVQDNEEFLWSWRSALRATPGVIYVIATS